MNKIYRECVEYFSHKQKPAQILSDEAINTYVKQNIELPKVYADIQKEYSELTMPIEDYDTIALIYWDIALLSDDFVLYCLPVLLPKAVDYEDGALFRRLKVIDLGKIGTSDSCILRKLIHKMEADKRFF